MITTDEVKLYLHIPYDDDDAQISGWITQGYNYLADAIDNYDSLYSSNTVFAGKADLWVKTQWMPAMYDEREGMHSNTPNLNYVARSLLTQLQLYEYTTTE